MVLVGGVVVAVAAPIAVIVGGVIVVGVVVVHDALVVLFDFLWQANEQASKTATQRPNDPPTKSTRPGGMREAIK